MPSNKPVYDPHFECMKDIQRIVEARLLSNAKIAVQSYTLSSAAGAPSFYYMSFTPPDLNIEQKKVQRVVIEPGIPRESLIPEKIGPIAYWIIKQVKAKRPDWFIKGDIVYKQ